jgi:hypothetical protein
MHVLQEVPSAIGIGLGRARESDQRAAVLGDRSAIARILSRALPHTLISRPLRRFLTGRPRQIGGGQPSWERRHPCRHLGAVTALPERYEGA